MLPWEPVGGLSKRLPHFSLAMKYLDSILGRGGSRVPELSWSLDGVRQMVMDTVRVKQA